MILQASSLEERRSKPHDFEQTLPSMGASAQCLGPHKICVDIHLGL